MIRLCELYVERGIPLGDLRPSLEVSKDDLKGQIIIAPPSAIKDRWSRRLPDPVLAVASGWMSVKQRAKQGGRACFRFHQAHQDADMRQRTRAEILRNMNELDQLIDEILLASRLDAKEADLGTVEAVDWVGLCAEECARVGAVLLAL